MLHVADNTTGYFGVYLSGGQLKPYQARLRRGGKDVNLGYFATAEEAALCVARSPEGQAAVERAAAAAERAASAPPPLTSEEALQQAQAVGLTLLVADNTSGYYGVYFSASKPKKPYQARVKRGGTDVQLGSFVTAEEAALCFARSPEGQAAVEKAAAPPPAPPLTSEQVQQQAQAEGLTLIVNDNKSGYFGVYHHAIGKAKPYQARVSHGKRDMHLGYFATAEEAALCVARTPGGEAAAKKAAAAAPLTSEEARQQAQAEGLMLRVADNKAGYFGVTIDKLGIKRKPYQAQVRRGGKQVSLGYFATAEEAALCIARSPEGHVAAERAAAAPPLAKRARV